LLFNIFMGISILRVLSLNPCKEEFCLRNQSKRFGPKLLKDDSPGEDDHEDKTEQA